ncbi:hypothetical protein SAMN04488587_0188 [Methanococcoides vulcani]|uniref:Uncharacterized protein n=1 Tax=Methanococcoides vulcani TaxID=1353158 RepID=A0A1H9Y2V8_9EURY|nr:hypothetical protein [Methanococcoides vulcani]SES63136.1 hypothetical protein SAMN04488587_0188 [Methanococcoides vulcani]
METDIIVAIILTFGTVLAAAIGIYKKKSTELEMQKTKSSATTAAADISGTVVTLSGSNHRVTIANSKKQPSKLELVSVDFDESTDEYAKLDIKIRNVGDEPAYIKSVRFVVSDVFVPIEFREIQYSMQPVTWEYDVMFGSNPGILKCNVSQVVEPNGTDRFTIKMAQNESPPLLFMLARFRLEIVYNENDNHLDSENLICLINPGVQVDGCFIADTDTKKLQWNIEKTKEFKKLTGTRSSAADKLFEEI